MSKLEGVLTPLNSDVIITREIIEEETSTNICVFYDHDELKKLLEDALSDNLKNYLIRLNNAFDSLEFSNREVTIRSLSKESGLARKTLYRYEVLINTAKKMVLKSKESKIFKEIT